MCPQPFLLKVLHAFLCSSVACSGSAFRCCGAMAWKVCGPSSSPGLGLGAIYVGRAEHACLWAEKHQVGLIINAADVDYPWAPGIERRWLHIMYMEPMVGGNWVDRMRQFLMRSDEVLRQRRDVLIHCFVGKHRSGAAAVILIMFVQGVPLVDAMDTYFEARGLNERDKRICRKRLWALGPVLVAERILEASQLQWERRIPKLLVQAQPVLPLASSCVPEKPVPKRLLSLSSKASSCVPKKPVPKTRPIGARSAPAAPVAKALPKRKGAPAVPKPAVPKTAVQACPAPPPPATAKAQACPAHPPGATAKVQACPGDYLQRPKLSVSSCVPVAWAALASSASCSGVQAVGAPRPGSSNFAGRVVDVPPRSSQSSGVQARALRTPSPSAGRSALRCSSSPCARSRTRSRSCARSRSRSAATPPRLPDEGAWQCRCGSINRRSHMFCTTRGCGIRRPLAQDWVKGDWMCDVCGNHNFYSRQSCNNPHCTTMERKPGDWICPRCNNHNYSKNMKCNTRWCRRPKVAP